MCSRYHYELKMGNARACDRGKLEKCERYTLSVSLKSGQDDQGRLRL